jgi:hypothetical protein
MDVHRQHLGRGAAPRRRHSRCRQVISHRTTDLPEVAVDPPTKRMLAPRLVNQRNDVPSRPNHRNCPGGRE